MMRLGLLRHGLATGQEATAPLAGPGREGIRRLAETLARRGFRPVAAFASPYLRARDTALLVLERTAPGLAAVHLSELTPDADAREAWTTLRALVPAGGDVLVVSHLPVIARLAHEFTGSTHEFVPGTFLELAIEPGPFRGRVAPPADNAF